MDFKPLLPPASTKPPTQFTRQKHERFTLLRDQATIPTWLAIGAALQTLLYLLLGRIALLAAFLYPLYRTTIAFLRTQHILPNPALSSTIFKKYSAQIPQPDGTFGSTPSSSGIVCLLIGARNSTASPRGLLAPGFKEMGDFMYGMQHELDVSSDSEDYGFLGSSSWLSAGEKETGNELLWVMYFKDVEGLHAYAEGPRHREAWKWWEKEGVKFGYLGIWHEVFEAPPGCWETIYTSSPPTLMAATRHRRTVVDKEGAERTVWVSPIVDAEKGVLRTSAGRMGRRKMQESEKAE